MSDKLVTYLDIPSTGVVPSARTGFVRVYSRDNLVYQKDENNEEKLLTNTDSPPPPVGGAPTFVYIETPKKTDGLRLPKLQISDQDQRRETLALRPTLNDSDVRSDVYRLPSIDFVIADADRRREDVKFPLVKISDSGAKSDSTTVAVEYTQPGTYQFIVPAGIVGGVMKMEGIGAGGGGGSAVVNGGGGGKGGGYSRRNAQAVVAGQQLNIVVPAASTASTAGGVATVGVGAGQGSLPQQSSTVTGGETPANNSAVGTTALFAVGSFSFVASAQANNAQQTITIPATTQVGDLIILATGGAGSGSTQPPGFTVLTSTVGVGRPHLCSYKFAQSGDAGSSIPVQNTTLAAHNSAMAVYRGVLSFTSASANIAQPTTGPILYPSIAGNASSIAIYISHTVSGGVSAATTSTPGGVTRRVESNAQASGSACADETISDAVLTPIGGTIFLSAQGGNPGGAGSATAGGTGASAQAGTATGDITFTGGNGTNGSLTAGGNGGAGAGSSSNTTGNTPRVQFGLTTSGTGSTGATAVAAATASQPIGGGGGGATTAGAASGGARGGIRLTFNI